MDLYAEHILDHSKHPRLKRVLDDATVVHEEVNLSCGDMLSVQLKVEQDVITGIGWTGQGCAISQAAMSMLAETLKGKTVADVQKADAKQILSMLGVPIGARRLKCALLCLHTLKNTLHTLNGEPVQSFAKTMEDMNEK